jgi:hypothetical protein
MTRLFLLPLLLVAACADLGAVRDFAKLSASTADYRALVQRYETQPDRVARYAPRPPDATQLAQDRATRAMRVQPMLALQETLVTYMETLGRLAGDEAVAIDLNPLAAAAQKAGVVDAPTGALVSSVGDIILRAATGAARERGVRQMLEQGEAPVQAVIGRLRTLVGAFAEDDASERDRAATYYSFLARSSSDRAAQRAVSEWRDLRLAEIDSRAAGRTAYLAALDKISAGHRLLHARRDALSVSETVRQIRLLENELRVIGKNLQPLLPV